MSNSTFINLHEQMQNKGWISDWEFNETIDLYKYNNCTSIAACQSVGEGDYKSDIDINGAWIYHLGKLTSGQYMFYKTTLASFSGDLTSLTNGQYMFDKTTLASFNGDLSSLTNGGCMFRYTNLESFNVDLPNLTESWSMFYDTNLTSFNGDLPSLTNAHAMFFNTPLESFNGDLSSLIVGGMMFYKTALTSFSGDLSKLTIGRSMFYNSPLESFNGDLSSLTDGSHMFFNTALESFDGDLSSLTNSYRMFYHSALTSFNGDLSSLTSAKDMFFDTHARTYNIKHYKIVNGVKTLAETPVTATGLKTFNSDLSSLKSGYCMFGASNASPLSEESIMLIADTINDISSLNKSVESDWTYTYHDGSSEITGSIPSEQRGILHLGYDTTIADTSKIMKYCDRIANKGWVVYLNAALQVANNDVIETITLTNEDGSAIPYYYKPLQITNEDCAEFVDGNGKFYIIVGGQYVFGDDISTYGMFTSYEHAVNEISISLGLTPCEKPDEVIIEE